MNDAITKETTLTVGLDVGDRYVQVCVLDEDHPVAPTMRSWCWGTLKALENQDAHR